MSSTRNFDCPRLPPLRVELEMDQASFELVEPFLQLRTLQTMAQTLADALKRELEWAIDQHDYELSCLDALQPAAQKRLGDDLRERCLALRTRCESMICEISMMALQNASRGLQFFQSGTVSFEH